MVFFRPIRLAEHSVLESRPATLLASHAGVITLKYTTLIDTLKNFILQFKKANALILNTNQPKSSFCVGCGNFEVRGRLSLNSLPGWI
jgi:hypothetical protein